MKILFAGVIFGFLNLGTSFICFKIGNLFSLEKDKFCTNATDMSMADITMDILDSTLIAPALEELFFR